MCQFHMYPSAHCSTIYNSQDRKQLKCPLTNEWIKKIWYIYTMEYYPAIRRNKIRSFVMMWMNLEFHIIKEIFETMKRKNSKKNIAR